MRYSADWQVLLDDRILEILDEEDRVLSPKDIHEKLPMDYSEVYIGKRFRRLAEAGLVQRVHPDNALYAITDEGRAYLEGNYDVEKGTYIGEAGGESSVSESVGETNGNGGEQES